MSNQKPPPQGKAEITMEKAYIVMANWDGGENHPVLTFTIWEDACTYEANLHQWMDGEIKGLKTQIVETTLLH